MKHIKVFNLITGERKIVPSYVYLINRIEAEIEDCKRTIREYPDIGTVLDGSRFATQKVLESLKNKINDITNKETVFTSFYKTLFHDIDALNKICNNTENTSVQCVLIGQRIGYKIVANLIEDINKCKDASEKPIELKK